MDNDDLKSQLKELTNTVTELRIELAAKIATLETKSGVWGGIAAITVIVVAYIVKYIAH